MLPSLPHELKCYLALPTNRNATKPALQTELLSAPWAMGESSVAFVVEQSEGAQEDLEKNARGTKSP